MTDSAQAVSGWIGWLNAQPAGTQQLVVGVLLLAVGALGAFAWSGLYRLVVAIASSMAAQRTARAEQDKRLVPTKLLTAIEMPDAERVALDQVNSVIAAITAWRAGLTATMSRWSAQYAVTAPEQARAVLSKQASEFAEASKKLEKLAAEQERAYTALSNAWLSRMYWHEQRQSADNIVSMSRRSIVSLAEAARTTGEQHGRMLKTARSSFAGRTPELDRALEHFERVSGRLEVTGLDFAWLFASMVDFHKDNTGLRGLLRRVRKSAMGLATTRQSR